MPGPPAVPVVREPHLGDPLEHVRPGRVEPLGGGVDLAPAGERLGDDVEAAGARVHQQRLGVAGAVGRSAAGSCRAPRSSRARGRRLRLAHAVHEHAAVAGALLSPMSPSHRLLRPCSSGPRAMSSQSRACTSGQVVRGARPPRPASTAKNARVVAAVVVREDEVVGGAAGDQPAGLADARVGEGEGDRSAST